MEMYNIEMAPPEKGASESKVDVYHLNKGEFHAHCNKSATRQYAMVETLFPQIRTNVVHGEGGRQ